MTRPSGPERSTIYANRIAQRGDKITPYDPIDRIERAGEALQNSLRTTSLIGRYLLKSKGAVPAAEISDIAIRFRDLMEAIADHAQVQGSEKSEILAQMGVEGRIEASEGLGDPKAELAESSQQGQGRAEFYEAGSIGNFLGNNGGHPSTDY